MQVKQNEVVLTIKDAVRKDSGPYTLQLKNSCGVAEGSVQITVLGSPLLSPSFSYRCIKHF